MGQGRAAHTVWAMLFWLPMICGLAHPSAAQDLGLVQSPILTIESDRLFNESRFGQRVAREVEAEGAVLAAENRRIEAELTVEERALTDRRAEMAAEGFRSLADAFDEKVQGIRRAQDGKARALNQRLDSGRVAFFQAARPVLESVMRDAEASVILERSSVFLSARVTDITDLAIARIDAALGDGPDPQVTGDD